MRSDHDLSLLSLANFFNRFSSLALSSSSSSGRKSKIGLGLFASHTAVHSFLVPSAYFNNAARGCCHVITVSPTLTTQIIHIEQKWSKRRGRVKGKERTHVLIDHIISHQSLNNVLRRTSTHSSSLSSTHNRWHRFHTLNRIMSLSLPRSFTSSASSHSFVEIFFVHGKRMRCNDRTID
jgi:hypothetical protein